MAKVQLAGYGLFFVFIILAVSGVNIPPLLVVAPLIVSVSITVGSLALVLAGMVSRKLR